MFKEWDLVVVNYPMYEIENRKGTIAKNGEPNCHPVRFDEPLKHGGHSCRGLCPKGLGMFVDDEHLTLITNKPA